MFNRREMLRRSALLSLTPMVPTFLAQAARAAGAEADRRVLVVVQLDGGNDGLNTVVPFRDENYARLRPKLKIAADRVVKLNDEIGLHPSLRAAGQLFESGKLAIVQGVGYPNPNRSHFESMAIWQSARLNEAEHGQYGWLGRTLDSCCANETGPHAVFAGSGSAPVTLWGRRASVATLNSLDELVLAAPGDVLRTLMSTGRGRESFPGIRMADEQRHGGNDSRPLLGGELTQLVADRGEMAFTTAQRLSSLTEGPQRAGKSAYPDSQLGQQLKLVSSLIKSGSQARVYYTVQSGYDTHATQQFEHAELLRVLGDALKAFVDDLAANALDDRVLVLAFSEFGRRAAENASAGTDHGAAAPVFLAGSKVSGGVLGPTPNLADLDGGDVKMAIDFRQVYAAILQNWLDIRPAEVLSGQFNPLPLLRA